MQRRGLLAACALAALTIVPWRAYASASPQAVAVLHTEASWLRAIRARDPKALARILAPDFTHITFTGVVRHRDDELRLVTQPKPYAQTTSAQTVDFAGAVAVVHGINTVTRDGRVVLRLRYTDVYEETNGSWRALSAQETAIREHGTPAPQAT